MSDDEVTAALDRLDDAARQMRSTLRVLRLWVATAVVGVLIALAAAGVAVWDVHHGTQQRARIQCLDARAHVEVTSDAVTDILDLIAVEVRDDPAAAQVVQRVRVRSTAALAERLAELPAC